MRMKIFDILAVAFLLSLSLTLAITFFQAFFNGGQIMVQINTVGEQWFEAILIPIVIVMGMVTFIRLAKKVKRRK